MRSVVSSVSWLVAVALLASCGPRDRDPPRERVSDEPLEIAPPPLIDDDPTPLGLPAPQTYEILEGLTSLLVPIPTEGECALLAEDEPNAPFGAALAPYVHDADAREVVCMPAIGGFQCRVSLIKTTGGEDEEYGVFLDVHVDGAHVIEPRSITCRFAG